jgi:flagellar hook-associated protein 2
MATNFVNALGAGSGIDTQQLAKDLMEATREPRKAVIDEKIAKSEARISGYGVIQFSLGELKTAFSGLNDLSDFASLQVANTQASALGVVASPEAAAGSYQVNVTQVAQAQRTASYGFDARSTALNVGESFDLNLTVGSGAAQATQTITVDTDTPAGVVAAINGTDFGITAQLIQIDDETWKIVVTGDEGEDKNFTLTSTSATPLGFDVDDSGDDPPIHQLQSAQNAELTVNGIDIVRATNSVSDVIDGVTFNLATITSGAARIDLTRDTSGITQKIEDLVTAYNNFEENLKILGDRASEVEEFGGALAGDSLLQNIRSQVRSMLTSTSSTPGSTVTAPRDVGLSFDRYGVLQFDKEKLATQLQSNFDEVAQMFSANTNNQSVYSVADAGVAGDAVKAIDEMMRSTGLIAQQTDNATKQVDRFKADLERLEDQMQKLLDRYTRQFSAMESIVGSSNSLRESLKGTFEGMANAYKK